MPQILPFSFGEDEINLDEATTAACTVVKGDSPIKIWWTLSDTFEETEKNLTTNDGVVITRNSPKVSIMTIEAVQARHKGNYSCYASNRAGITQHTAYLAINGDCYLINVNNYYLSLTRPLQFVFPQKFCHKYLR